MTNETTQPAEETPVEPVALLNHGKRQPGLGWLVPVVPLAFMVVGLAALLGRFSLWRDEALTAKYVRIGLFDLLDTLRTTRGSEAAQPLYYLVLWPWQRLAGASEIALRLPSLAAALAASFILYLTARRLRPGLWTGTAGLLLSMPVVIWYALEARPYALILLLVSLHLHESVRLLQGDPTAAAPLAVVTLLVTAAYSVAGCAAIGAFALVLWRSSADVAAPAPAGDGARRRAAARIVQLVAIGASLALVLFSVTKARDAGGPEPRSPAATAAYAGYELTVGRSLGFGVRELRTSSPTALAKAHPTDIVLVFGVTGLLLLIAAGSLRALLRRRDLRVAAVLVLPWVALGLVFTVFSLLTEVPLLGRHLLFVVPPAYLAVLLGASYHPSARVAAGTTALWAVGVVALGGIAFSDRYEKDDFRGIVRILERCQVPASRVAVTAPLDGLRYYNGDFDSNEELPVEDSMALVLGGAKDVAVVDVNHLDPKGAVSTAAAERHGLSVLARTDLRIVSSRSLEECGRAERT